MKKNRMHNLYPRNDTEGIYNSLNMDNLHDSNTFLSIMNSALTSYISNQKLSKLFNYESVLSGFETIDTTNSEIYCKLLKITRDLEKLQTLLKNKNKPSQATLQSSNKKNEQIFTTGSVYSTVKESDTDFYTSSFSTKSSLLESKEICEDTTNLNKLIAITMQYFPEFHKFKKSKIIIIFY
jgi:hypothetical protein